MFFSEPILKSIGVIPARMQSTRLPRKPLAQIAGKPMIQWVWEGASSSERLEKTVIATDSEEIINAAEAFGAEAYMTPPELPSGTDRIAWLYEKMDWDYDVVVNIQGDEPLIRGDVIDRLVDGLSGSLANVATLVTPITSKEEVQNPNTVKVTTQTDGTALYFSRAPIPYHRDSGGINLEQQQYLKHIGIYAYREAALKAFSSLPPTDLEETEKLEQLRLLQSNYKYLCVPTDHPFISVDTESDRQKAEELIKEAR